MGTFELNKFFIQGIIYYSLIRLGKPLTTEISSLVYGTYTCKFSAWVFKTKL